MQNKAVKIVGGANYFDHATPYFIKFKIDYLQINLTYIYLDI